MRPFENLNEPQKQITHEEQMAALNKALADTEAYLTRLRRMGLQFEEKTTDDQAA